MNQGTCEICTMHKKRLTKLTAIEGFTHALTFLVGYCKLLIGDKKLGARSLARLNHIARMITLSSETETVLISKLPHPLQTRPTIDRNKIFSKKCYELLVWIDGITYCIK